jgi:spore germination cell wall hydrolase CwlJ-like protein
VYAKAQFSWTLKKRLPNPDPVLYKHCEEIALAALKGRGVKGLDKSLFYHATYIKNPHWVDPRHEARQVGQHIFYNKAKNSNLEI